MLIKPPSPTDRTTVSARARPSIQPATDGGPGLSTKWVSGIAAGRNSRSRARAPSDAPVARVAISASRT